jgi:hypothetical protein
LIQRGEDKTIVPNGAAARDLSKQMTLTPLIREWSMAGEKVSAKLATNLSTNFCQLITTWAAIERDREAAW